MSEKGMCSATQTNVKYYHPGQFVLVEMSKMGVLEAANRVVVLKLGSV